MALQIQVDNDNIVVIRAIGKLLKEDYVSFAPEFECAVREDGKLRVLFDVTSFDGWEPDSLWEEVKFDVTHNSDIRRLAVVGESKWHHALVAALKPFAFAETRYFERAQIDLARRWLLE